MFILLNQISVLLGLRKNFLKWNLLTEFLGCEFLWFGDSFKQTLIR